MPRSSLSGFSPTRQIRDKNKNVARQTALSYSYGLGEQLRACNTTTTIILLFASYYFLLPFFSFIFFHLIYSRCTSSLPSCLWSQRIFPSLPGSRLTIFYRDASPALLQLVNQWLNFTYSRSHAFRYERKNTNPTLVRIELTTSVLAVW